MTKRVSISGQGADIFFGEAGSATDAQKPSAQETRRETTRTSPSISHESKTDSKPARQMASQSDSKTARQLSILRDPLDEATKRQLLDLLAREHRTHNTFRYGQEELDAVRDIVYEMEVRRGVKISRNDVMRLALNYLIEDYRAQGDDSIIVRLFRKGDRRPPARFER